MDKRKLAREVIEHSDEATDLLNMSIAIHKAERQGLISEDEAIDECVKLNNQAISKMEEAINLQQEFLKND
jgi:hypothetical protein